MESSSHTVPYFKKCNSVMPLSPSLFRGSNSLIFHAFLIDGKRPVGVLALLGLLVVTFSVRLALCYTNCVTILI